MLPLGSVHTDDYGRYHARKAVARFLERPVSRAVAQLVVHRSVGSILPRRGALDDRATIDAGRQQTERAARLFAETR
jgi:hypothetical protein